MILLEFMANGSLKEFLLNSKPTPEGLVELLPYELAKMCRDVASGMAFLSSMGYVHRDLAARYRHVVRAVRINLTVSLKACNLLFLF